MVFSGICYIFRASASCTSGTCQRDDDYHTWILVVDEDMDYVPQLRFIPISYPRYCKCVNSSQKKINKSQSLSFLVFFFIIILEQLQSPTPMTLAPLQVNLLVHLCVRLSARPSFVSKLLSHIICKLDWGPQFFF